MNECVNEGVCNRKHNVSPNVKKTKQTKPNEHSRKGPGLSVKYPCLC